MADDPNISSSAKRFGVFVPAPKARINLGSPDKSDTGPFGYTGLSLQSDVHLFIDANKHTLFQTGVNFNGQVGGKWLQYSNADMVVSCTANANFSADNKLLIAAGAGQGQITALDHGTTPRLVDYNNLQLHYRVEEVQNGLYEFFHGRRRRSPTRSIFNAKTHSRFVVDQIPAVSGGFADNYDKSMRELMLLDSRAAGDLPTPLGEVQAEVLGKKEIAGLEYGYSKYFSRFDPYSKTNPAKFTNPVQKAFASMRNALVPLRRLADVVTKYGNAITDNAIVSRGLKLADSISNVFLSTSAFFRLSNNLETLFTDPANSAFPDEFRSGAQARVGGPPRPEGDSIHSLHATISSSKETFALQPGDTMSLYDERSGTAYVTPAIAATAAQIAGANPVLGTNWVTGAQWIRVTIDGGNPIVVMLGQPPPPSISIPPPSQADPSIQPPISISSVSPAQYIAAIVAPIQAALGGNVAFANGKLTITSPTRGTSSSISIQADSSATLTNLGLSATKASGTGNVANVDAVTAEELAALVNAAPGITGKLEASAGDGAVVLTATKAGKGSFAKGANHGSSTMADTVGLAKDNEIDTWTDAKNAVSNLEYWNHEMQKWPEDTRNLTRPLREGISDVVTLATQCEKLIENVTEFVVPGLAMPGPPKAIGLVAKDGISLGTPDRIVGSGGKGIVFVADGGLGERNEGKFVPTEQILNRILEWSPTGTVAKYLGWFGDDPKPPRSLGFRVISDSAVDLTGTTAAQLMAMGRALTSDGSKFGIGVARVGASRAAEVCAVGKVVISARDKGTDDKTGGRVEVVGQTIAIGGTNLPDRDGAKDIQDFKDEKGIGIEPPKLSKQYFGGFERVDPDLSMYAWPEDLRKSHPNTERVFVHAAKETCVVVGPYMVLVDAAKGVTISHRKPSDDPMANEMDDQKPSIQIDDQKLTVQLKKDGEAFVMEKELIHVMNAQKAGLEVDKDTTRVWGDTGEVVASKDGVDLMGSAVTIHAKQQNVTVSGQKVLLG